MSDDQAVGAVLAGVGVAVFAIWAAVSLLVGKTYMPHYGGFGEIVDRRKEPWSYWITVGVASVLAAACLFALIRDMIPS
jgi:hypothetical protein